MSRKKAQQEQKNNQQPEEKQTKLENYSELKNQITTIEQMLSESSNTRIACIVIGTGNYIERYGTEEEMKSLNSDYEEAKNECSQYHVIYDQIADFVAEPELALVKQKLLQTGNML